jgi:CheY-like chemotaxis protein
VQHGKEPTVLVVEDDSLIRLVVSDTLREEGFVVLEAADADEALSVLKMNGPLPLLLTDIRMPGSMDGVGLARTVRYQRPDMKIVFLSSHPSDPTILRWGDAFISKPYRVGELVAKIHEVLA